MKDADAAAEDLVIQRIAAALPADIVAPPSDASPLRLGFACSPRDGDYWSDLLERRAAPRLADRRLLSRRPRRLPPPRRREACHGERRPLCREGGPAPARVSARGSRSLPPLVQLGVGAGGGGRPRRDRGRPRRPSARPLAHPAGPAVRRACSSGPREWSVPLNQGGSALSWSYVANVLSLRARRRHGPACRSPSPRAWGASRLPQPRRPFVVPDGLHPRLARR